MGGECEAGRMQLEHFIVCRNQEITAWSQKSAGTIDLNLYQ